SQNILLFVFAAAGVAIAIATHQWERKRRAEICLSAILAAALGIFAAAAHPTHGSYFTLTVPFLAILASAGFVVLSSAVFSASRGPWLVIAAMCLYLFGPARFVLQHHGFRRSPWGEFEIIANEVNRVTPRDGLLCARDWEYVASGRLPPP